MLLLQKWPRTYLTEKIIKNEMEILAIDRFRLGTS